MDLTKYKLLHEGTLTLILGEKRTKKVDLHVLLLEDSIIFLQKQVQARVRK